MCVWFVTFSFSFCPSICADFQNITFAPPTPTLQPTHTSNVNSTSQPAASVQQGKTWDHHYESWLPSAEDLVPLPNRLDGFWWCTVWFNIHDNLPCPLLTAMLAKQQSKTEGTSPPDSSATSFHQAIPMSTQLWSWRLDQNCPGKDAAILRLRTWGLHNSNIWRAQPILSLPDTQMESHSQKHTHTHTRTRT